MADNIEVVASDPLLLQERRKSISLMFLRFIGVVLLAVAACYLFISNFNSQSPETEKNSLTLDKQELVNIRPFLKELEVQEEQYFKKEVCDLSIGKWIPKAEGPPYTYKTCHHVASYTNCLKNGRPDTGFLHWKWQPSGCDLPPFDPLKFLNSMRNKSWAFIGDAIFSNHVDSLLCLISPVATPDEIYYDGDKTRTWYYPEYNLTIYEIWSPFLLASRTEHDLPYQIHLDMLDGKWTEMYNKYDYIVFSGSQWLYKRIIMYENNEVVGCHFCPDLDFNKIDDYVAYRRALQLTFKFITTSEHKPFVIFRTWAPNHWEDGGSPSERICNRTKPFKEGEFNGKSSDLRMRRVEVEEFAKAASIGARNEVRIKLLDIYHLSLLRPDGHPGPYGGHQSVENDCIHWCLPGPIDTWNELLMKVINGDAHEFVPDFL
ncbi:protein trichome birefringence-like 26 [Dioscorea cayenensis subsp. rotundata]|uniref:Protein trichome birefringence-like 26 n=1 Tax=Dioscorea cayennensis subsp. rotundata TaxID=55577 RepID=A0AB40B1D0_DIOCR|nr:protein trichome birefringence-like 26 [Dioscorea cayenensis subsp. rotundata]